MNLIYKIRGAKTQNELYEVIFFFNIFRAGSFSLKSRTSYKDNYKISLRYYSKLFRWIVYLVLFKILEYKITRLETFVLQ